MWQRHRLSAICSALLIVLLLLPVGRGKLTQADAISAPSLVISQVKITASAGQFITLYNANNATVDMSKYQLEYFNNYDLSKATSSRLIALTGTVPPHGYFMINDSALLLCYQMTVDSVSLGLSSTAGMVELLGFNQSGVGSSVVPMLQDYIGWSKSTASGAQTLPTTSNAFLQRLPVDTIGNPDITGPGVGSWQAVQPSSTNPCSLVSASSGNATPVSSGLNQLLPATEPPATIFNDVSGSIDTPDSPSLPVADLGLMAPQVNELLPNPNGTGNDATDEFIELYNPNPVPFDLSGFGLQAGTTVLHKYIFPAGASLPAQSFTAFYASSTGLSLSNTAGQVKLIDPFGNGIAASNEYGTAKDGLAWALAKGKWYWTTTPTPSAANTIHQPATKLTKSSSTSAKAKTTRSTAKAKGSKTTNASAGQLASSYGSDDPAPTPVHPLVVALIAGLALLYGAYEYRTDLANRIHQLRVYYRARRADRT